MWSVSASAIRGMAALRTNMERRLVLQDLLDHVCLGCGWEFQGRQHSCQKKGDE